MPPTRTAKGKGKGRAEPQKTEAALPLGKQLSHTDKAVRDQAVRNLTAFLSRGGQGEDDEEGPSGYTRLSDGEMAKLWKGLFYCFWMSDKPLVQQRLAQDLADLLLLINPAGGEEARLDAALAFLEGFWTALVREWGGIDRLRIDKYYMLIRRYVNATFRLLAREGWDVEAVEKVNGILTAEKGPMSWREKSVPSSLATHLADVYLDELEKVSATSEEPVPIVAVLEPFAQLAANTRTPTVHTRLMSMVFKPALAALKEDDADEDDERPSKRSRAEEQEFENLVGNLEVDGEKVDKAEAREAVLKAMFKEAAKEDAVESNRRKIYAVVREESDE